MGQREKERLKGSGAGRVMRDREKDMQTLRAQRDRNPESVRRDVRQREM